MAENTNQVKSFEIDESTLFVRNIKNSAGEIVHTYTYDVSDLKNLEMTEQLQGLGLNKPRDIKKSVELYDKIQVLLDGIFGEGTCSAFTLGVKAPTKLTPIILDFCEEVGKYWNAENEKISKYVVNE